MSDIGFNHYDHALSIKCPTCHAPASITCLIDFDVPSGARVPLHIRRYRLAFILYKLSQFIGDYEMKTVQLFACNSCGRVAISTDKQKIIDGSMDRECIQGKFEAITILSNDDMTKKVTLPKEPTE